MQNNLFRSLMFVPAHNDKLVLSSIRFDADIILFDVEDSVQPESMKQVARDNIIKYINEGLFKGRKVYVRVNDLQSGHVLKDLHQLTISGVDGFVCPKVKTDKDVYFFDKLLESIEYEKKYELGKFKIIPLIETAAAVLNAQDICFASKRVKAIAFGSEDYVTDMQGIHDKESVSLFTARNLIVMAARAANVIPVDTVYINVHDLEGLEKNLILSKNLGFEGMLILSPKQLPLAHKYYSPSDEEVEQAKEMLRMAEESEKEAKGVAVVNNKFVGPPLVERAKNLLKKHQMVVDKERKYN
jgi:citrate lyase subunit beta/citryl-CoA lyase